ncbi:cell division protein DedD [Musicola paradisiaca]|uniref:Cell division protein DedD n=1 Tax=Musicola paradisiaca (strain Ech703) TaxID=579405 RepID=C6C9S7_MUSP7|nr:cell division protein DedD [Musicola paradisiaca]ACS86349.1 Sporulation domain protein [Musicola paradisiaca Ech703]
MASKFQNRLVGTVVLVALGVIVLPGLLDGKKKHYEDTFAAIPLVPKPGDTLESESIPPITQSLSAQPPEGAAAAMQDKNGSQEDKDEPATEPPVSRVTTQPVQRSTPPASPPIVTERQTVTQLAPPAMKAQPVKPEAKTKPEVKVDTRNKPELKSPEVKTEARQLEAKSVEKPADNKTTARAVEKPAPVQEQAPAGQAFVVQLGALKNADKVNEVVAKLRLSGYRAYTVPSMPVAGQITRIYVGPDASKQKLESSLGELQQISGLSGQVRAYSAR